MRDGVPLPGSTPSALISLLAHRVFGPLRLDRVRAVLDYHGMDGYPADHRSVVATRHGITAPTVSNWCEVLQAAGSQLPLSIELATECVRRTRPGENQLGRVRIAATLELQDPRRPATIPDHSGPLPADLAAAAIAARVLAAAGPLPLTALHAAVGRAPPVPVHSTRDRSAAHRRPDRRRCYGRRPGSGGRRPATFTPRTGTGRASRSPPVGT